MFNQIDTNKIKSLVKEFFDKMTIADAEVDSSVESLGEQSQEEGKTVKAIINLKIRLQEPQILIGQQGQTLFEMQRLLRIILNKQLGENYYVSLDINDYKRNKIDYLENLAQNAADEVSMMKKEKELAPMNSYERRLIHAKLSSRGDVITESIGEGQQRRLVIKPK